VSIKTPDVAAYIVHGQAQGIIAHKGTRKGERIGDVSNAEINRELQTLKRFFNLAIEQDPIAMKPTIKLLQESAARAGFFEAEQITSVLTHLPAEIQPVIRFAYYTGWRIASEVLPLEWRQVDFAAGEVRLDAGTTKNKEGRVIYMTTDSPPPRGAARRA
jgi:integrase